MELCALTEIPTIYTDIAKGELRHVLTGVAGILLAHGVLSGGQTAEFVEVGSALAIWLATAAWSAYQKRTKQQIVVVAAAAAGLTEHEVTTQIAAGVAVPSVLTPATAIPRVTT